MKGELSKENIVQAEQDFQNTEYYTHIVSPRLKSLYRISKEFKDLGELKWSFNYDHVNQHANKIRIDYLPCQGTDFSFFFEIPLRQAFELQLYLGTSSIHFIDIYNYLINNNLIQKDEFPVKAEYRTIPHLLLQKNVKRYQMKILSEISSSNDYEDCIDASILQVLEEAFKRFLPIFQKLLKA